MKHVPLLLLLPLSALGQTTQGLIWGRVLHSETGAAVPGAMVSFAEAATNAQGAARTDSAGWYILSALSPGSYRIRVTAAGFQAQEAYNLELPVAARIDLNFALRPLSDVWERGQFRSVFLPGSKSVVTFYGPDLEAGRSLYLQAPKGARGALESTVSQVIDPAQVRELPLAGRDVYTMLVAQPGVTADMATARGLGLSINGQRPSSSNFLLDGVEHNNALVTGPLTAVAPEAVQEYRISTNNFSAEYGGTAGFVANAVTRSGGNVWHGTGYFHFGNEALNANGFQQNLRGLARRPDRQYYSGFHLGGAVVPNRVFVSGALEYLRSRSRGDPLGVSVPTSRLLEFAAPNSVARRLLERFPPPATPQGILLTGVVRFEPPASLDRWLAVERIDSSFGEGTHRLQGRLAVARMSRPDFIWSPYRDFVSGLAQDTLGAAVNLQSSLHPNVTNEARAARNTDDLYWDRAHPEIPTLSVGDGTLLPGSPAFYAYRNRSRGWELVDNLTWVLGGHILKFGAGILLRGLDGFLTAGRDGMYGFGTALDFALDRPELFSASVSRAALPRLRPPDFDKKYRQSQYSVFGQDTFRVTSRLVLNYGVRYENFGAPVNAGESNEVTLALGPGAQLSERITASGLLAGRRGGQSLYDSDRNNLGVRFGFSADLTGTGRTLVRGAYGIFYDRPFDNSWQNLRNNSLLLPAFPVLSFPVDYLASASASLATYEGMPTAADFPWLTLFQPNFRSAYVHSYFLGVQQQGWENWLLEVNTLGSLGRKLMTTDLVNRRRYNPELGYLAYRGNQGLSNYNALTALARYRARGGQLQIAYTWGHTIDNQSEPLAGDFFDLSFVRITSGQGRAAVAAFSREFDSRGDRGNSDFDQRHNLVTLSIWDLPAPASPSWTRALLRDWKFAHLAAFRTGFPYTVMAPPSVGPDGEVILNNRADIVDARRTRPAQAADVPGGRLLLDARGFALPADGRRGSSGRNAFRGPGLFNIDVSLSRSFPVPALGETGRVVVRADGFNIVNHVNLNNPKSLLGASDFGAALYGRAGRDPGFPALVPLRETARQIQLLLRVEF